MGNVYLINAFGTNKYKIGVTKNDVDKRLKQLQTGNAEELIISRVFECEHYRKVEGWLHRKHFNKREEGEWFLLEDEDVFSFVNDCETAHNTIKLLIEQNPFYK